MTVSSQAFLIHFAKSLEKILNGSFVKTLKKDGVYRNNLRVEDSCAKMDTCITKIKPRLIAIHTGSAFKCAVVLGTK